MLRHVPLALGVAIVGSVVAAVATGAVDPGAAWVQLMAWIVATQRELHQGLATALRAVQSGGQAAVLWLALLGFLYGVFHAAGPGHGKVVITTYLATQKETLWRGIALAVTASMLQGVVAITAVFAAMLVFAQTARQSQWLTDRIELMSFALVAALGLSLVWRHGRNLLRPQTAVACGGCGGHHDHHHAPPPGKAFAAGILSIGLRPCSGAILVLVLAIALNLRLAGIAAVVAMSIGTALTVSGLAALAVLAREQAGRLAQRLEISGARLGRAVDVVALLGGAAAGGDGHRAAAGRAGDAGASVDGTLRGALVPWSAAQRGASPSAVSGGVLPIRWWSGRACQTASSVVTGSMASQA